MFAVLKRLIIAILEIGLLEFLRRLGWKWALSMLLTAAAVLLLVLVVIVVLVGILL